MNSKGIDCLGDNGVCIPVSTHSVKTVKKQTNADKIRSMNDEELAEFLHNYTSKPCSFCSGCEKSSCKNNTPKWLKSEAE